MNFRNYASREKIIKRIIFWSVIFAGIIALLFIQTRAGTAPAPVGSSTGFIPGVEVLAQGLPSGTSDDSDNSGGGNNNGSPAAPIDVCDQGIGVGCLGGTDEATLGTGSNAIVAAVMQVVFFMIFVAGAIAVFFIVLAGYQMITANGVTDKYENGRRTLQYAVLGLILAIISVSIVFIITQIVPGFDLFGGGS
jgi:hypothetical protein